MRQKVEKTTQIIGRNTPKSSKGSDAFPSTENSLDFLNQKLLKIK